MESSAASAASVAGLEPGVVIADKYRIDRMLGRGGMGVVYAATHVLTGKQLALKWLLPAAAADPVSAERFLREAQAAGRIHHSNVVQVFDVGTHQGSPFMVMELLQGEPLTSRLSRLPTEPSEAVTWLLAVTRGLAAAHKVGVIHRDMKPDNIFLCATEEGPAAKILDFGISKLADEGALSLTQSGVTMGTPFYMSPEQIRGNKNVDHRTDVYSMGVILYEALVGRVPFSGATYAEVILEVAMAQVVPPSQLRGGLPDGLEAVVLKAMARNPDERFQSMDELAAALRPFARASGSSGLQAVYDSGPRPVTGATVPFVTPTGLPTPGSLPIPGGLPALDESAQLPVRRHGMVLRIVAAAVVLLVGLGVTVIALRGREPRSVEASPASTVPARPTPPAAQAPTAAPAPSAPASAAVEASPTAVPDPGDAPVAADVSPRPGESMRDGARRRPEPGANATAAPAGAAPEPTRPSRTRRTGSLSADEF
ncbi:MAG: serine/threonine-protein kinase [Polyangiales bacterium]